MSNKEFIENELKKYFEPVMDLGLIKEYGFFEIERLQRDFNLDVREEVKQRLSHYIFEEFLKRNYVEIVEHIDYSRNKIQFIAQMTKVVPVSKDNLKFSIQRIHNYFESERLDQMNKLRNEYAREDKDDNNVLKNLRRKYSESQMANGFVRHELAYEVKKNNKLKDQSYLIKLLFFLLGYSYLGFIIILFLVIYKG